MLLLILRILAWLLILIIAVETALWGQWTNSTAVVSLLVTVIVAYGGVVSVTYSGEKEQWPQKLLAWIHRHLFEKLATLIPTCCVLFVTVVGLGWLLQHAWYVHLVGDITYNGKPVEEEIHVTLRTPYQSYEMAAKDSRVEVKVPRNEVEGGITITAEGKRFRTKEPLSVKPERFEVPLVSRFTVVVGDFTYNTQPVKEEIKVTLRTASQTHELVANESRFQKELPRNDVESGITLTAESKHFRTSEPFSVKSERFEVRLANRFTLIVRAVDTAGNPKVVVEAREVGPHADWIKCPVEDELAYFEAAKGSAWQVRSPTRSAAPDPPFVIENVPFTYVFHLNAPKPAETAKDVPVSFQVERLSRPTIRTLMAGATDVPRSLPGYDAQFIGWLPAASNLLVREGYLLSYNPTFKIPNWTAYQLAGKPQQFDRSPFVVDPDLPSAAAATTSDYMASGYDRGHMVAIGDMQFVSANAVRQAGYMSAVCPQTPLVNQKVWLAAEKWGREMAIKYKKVSIIAGTVFSSSGNAQDIAISYIGKNRVAVPTAFFRIHVCEIDGKMRVLSVLVPNQISLPVDLSQYFVSVNRIQELTGLEFFRSLPAEQRKALLAETPRTLWE